MSNYFNSQWRLPNEENKNKISNYSLDFTGSELINVSDLSNIPTGSSHRTVSAWFNTSYSGTAEPTIVSYGASATAQIFIIMLKGGSGADAGRLRFVGYSRDYTFTTADLRDNQWHHVAMTYNGTIIEAFLDGSSVGSFTPSTVLNTGTSFFKIGVQWSYWVGQIDSVCIFDYVLSPSQVTTLYGSSSTGIGNPMSLSPKPVAHFPLADQDVFNGADYLVPNAAVVGGYSPYALDFDGTNWLDTAVYGISTISSSLSIWFKTSSTAANKGFFGINSGSLDYYISILQTGSTGALEFWNGAAYIYITPVINDGNWHNFVATYNHSSSVLKVYTDGAETYSATYSQPSGMPLRYIGSTFQTSRRWVGNLSNAAIWNTNLSATEVTEIFNSGRPSNLNNHSAVSSLVSWWQLGSNSSFNSNSWTVLDEKGTNNGVSSTNMSEVDIVNGVGYTSNGVSSGMSDNVIGDAPYSTSNSLSVNMDVLDRTTDIPS